MKNKIEFDEKICKNKRNKKYYEHLAKIILEKFLPQRFYDLEISARPDIFWPWISHSWPVLTVRFS